MRDRSALISKLLSSRKSRESYIRSKLNVLLPSQIRGLRLRRALKQEELGREAEMKQSRISAMERPGETQFNIETLIRVAAALRVGLKVEFVSFSEMLEWENTFSQDAFDVPKIEDDIAFVRPQGAIAATQIWFETRTALDPLAGALAGRIVWFNSATEDEAVQALARKGKGYEVEQLPSFAQQRSTPYFGTVRTEKWRTQDYAGPVAQAETPPIGAIVLSGLSTPLSGGQN